MYFRLEGDSFADNKLRLFADKLAEEADGRYTGGLLPLESGGFAAAEFLALKEGWDASFVADGETIRPLAELNLPASKIALSAYTTMPSLHIRTFRKPFTVLLAQQFISGEAEGLPAATLAGAEWKHRVVYGFDRMASLK
jgi:galactose mutarotase-like enzyme